MAASTKSSLRFYHSDSLRTKTLAFLTTVEQASDRTRYRGALADLAIELTNSGMEYYFLRALQLAKVGFVVEQSARLSLGVSMGVLTPVIRNVIGHMNQAQLLIVCGHIRQLME